MVGVDACNTVGWGAGRPAAGVGRGEEKSDSTLRRFMLPALISR